MRGYYEQFIGRKSQIKQVSGDDRIGQFCYELSDVEGRWCDDELEQDEVREMKQIIAELQRTVDELQRHKNVLENHIRAAPDGELALEACRHFIESISTQLAK